MSLQLAPHQHRAVNFLTQRKFAFLWDDPGLGKTPPTVVAAGAIMPRRVLVFCPAVIREMWAREFGKWASWLPIAVEPGIIKTAPQEGATILSHANLADNDAYRLLSNSGADGPYDLIIVDECHEFRSYNTKRTSNLLFSEDNQRPPLWAYAERFWGLTGTPLVNSGADLYPFVAGPMRIIVSWWDFVNKFTNVFPDPSRGFKTVGVKAVPELVDFLRPHVLRRTAASVGLQLPRLTKRNIDLKMEPGEIIRAMADLQDWSESRLQAALERNDEINDPILSRVRHALGLAKAPYIARYMHEHLISGAGPIVCFFQHTAVKDCILADLTAKGYTVGVIDGKTSRAKLAQAEHDCQHGKLHGLLVQTQAGGMGLTLTRSNHAIIAELPWTSTALTQALARIHRFTQMRDCVGDILRAPDCWLENILAKVVDQKQKASAELLTGLTST